jgi:hypothetical protein
MVCINDDTKKLILNKLDEINVSEKEVLKLAEVLDTMQECTTSDTPKGRKKMRPLSKYNLFLSTCMGEKKQRMDTCVPTWRKIKECIQNGDTFEHCKLKEGY